MLFAEDFGTGELLWSMLWFFLFFIWIWILILVFGDIFRSHDMGGWAQGAVVIFIIFLPYLGVFVYLIARGGKMQDTRRKLHKPQDAQLRAVRPERRRVVRESSRRGRPTRGSPRQGRDLRRRVRAGEGEGTDDLNFRSPWPR